MNIWERNSTLSVIEGVRLRNEKKMLKINSHSLPIVDDSFEILIRDNVHGNDNPSAIKYFSLLQD